MSKEVENVNPLPIPDDTQQKETVIVQVPRVTARTIPGPASPQNKGAIDW